MNLSAIIMHFEEGGGKLGGTIRHIVLYMFLPVIVDVFIRTRDAYNIGPILRDAYSRTNFSRYLIV